MSLVRFSVSLEEKDKNLFSSGSTGGRASAYCIILNVCDHFIFAQIREFAKI